MSEEHFQAGALGCLEASRSNWDRSVAGQSDLQLYSLLPIQVYRKHLRVLLIGQTSDRRKRSCECHGDILISVKVQVQNNPNQQGVIWEQIQILCGPHSYSSFKGSVGESSDSQA